MYPSLPASCVCIRLALAAGVILWLAAGPAAELRGAAFTFGLGANHLLGAADKDLTSEGFTMHLSAGPPGSGLWETGTNLGMGVDATAILGPGGSAARFDRINSTSEYIEFSFDQSGILTGLDFDGVKDEALEYFILETAPLVRINLFDSAANLTISGAVDNAVLQGAVTGQVVYLLEGGGFDDETHNLAVPFVAGQVFRLTYNEVGGGLGTEFEPTVAPNGARLQRILVAPVPEPAALTLAALAALALVASRRISRRARPS